MLDKTEQNGALSGCRFRLASVYILSAPLHLDRRFDYIVPEGTEVERGDFAAVPFGGGNRPETALVFDVYDTELQEPIRYKPISSVLSKEFSLSDEGIAIVEFLKERTFCTTGDAVRTIAPIGSFAKLEQYIEIVNPLSDFYPECCTEYQVYEYIKSTKNCTKTKLFAALGAKKASAALSVLEEQGFVKISICAHDSSNIKYITCYYNTCTDDDIRDIELNGRLRSKKHIEILKFLAEYGKTEHHDLLNAVGASSAQVKALLEKKLIAAEEKEQYRMPYHTKGENDNIVLSDIQQSAADTVTAMTKSGKPQCALLYGVTGSGKTQVMRAVMEQVISDGKSVILLVPEISLTPQTISFFSRCFGERTCVIHSGLSSGERFDAWRRIKRGEIDVCIGTRSAVFAPFENLGLIVIDEEQEHTYKSDSAPKYHTRDVASFRCGKQNAVLLLASATPSVESFHKATTGAYTLVELPSRYGKGGIPSTDIVDMRTDTKDGNFSLFSSKLVESLSENLAHNKQSILFLNRRGYHSFLSCPSCGNVVMCPHCSVSLTHHFSRFNENGYLSCHYCGYKTAVPSECPQCKKPHIKFMGYGTQLAQEQLQKMFPNAKILRMDADTTSGKFSYDQILGSFRNKEADILIGTQMVTKGHDFPDVTLVGMLSADQSLYLDDYRANERTFSLICQTVGRSGRRDDKGTALVQCYNPEHNVLTHAKNQDYKAFFDSEIAMRRALLFPPFCDIAAMTVVSDSESDAFSAANKLLEKIKTDLATDFTDVQLQIFGPFEAPVYKLNEKYRVRLVIKCKNTKRTRMLFRQVLKFFGDTMPKNILASIDINPSTL